MYIRMEKIYLSPYEYKTNLTLRVNRYCPTFILVFVRNIDFVVSLFRITFTN